MGTTGRITVKFRVSVRPPILILRSLRHFSICRLRRAILTFGFLPAAKKWHGRFLLLFIPILILTISPRQAANGLLMEPKHAASTSTMCLFLPVIKSSLFLLVPGGLGPATANALWLWQNWLVTPVHRLLLQPTPTPFAQIYNPPDLFYKIALAVYAKICYTNMRCIVNCCLFSNSCITKKQMVRHSEPLFRTVSIAFLKLYIWRVVRVVEGATLEMLCSARNLGFESLTLRQSNLSTHIICVERFFVYN